MGLAFSVMNIAMAATPLGGLAVAVSPDGKTLVAAGDNRTLYFINSATMEVTGRHWLGTPILAISFNKAGDRIVAESTDEALLLIDAANGKIIKQEDKAGKVAVALEVDLAVARNPSHSGQIVRVLSLTDLSDKASINFDKDDKIAALGLSPDGKTVAAWLEPVNDDSEPKNTKVPEGVKGLDADEFRQRNDGKTSKLLTFNAADGSKLSEQKLYFSPSATGATIAFQGDDVLIINYSNLNAKIDPKGEVTLFKLKSSYNYGIGVSADHQTLMGGGLAAGTQLKPADLSQKEFKIDRLPGWPEYFKDFAFATDGTSFGSTSGYRIIKINADGTFDKSYPIF
jgi:WD40 repeat protein